jgi:hypothetical protein
VQHDGHAHEHEGDRRAQVDVRQAHNPSGENDGAEHDDDGAQHRRDQRTSGHSGIGLARRRRHGAMLP